MRVVLLFFFSLITYCCLGQGEKEIEPVWKNYLKVNVFRVALGEGAIFYEHGLSEKSSVEFKLGYIYPSASIRSIVEEMSSIGNFFLNESFLGDFMSGYRYGGLLGIGKRDYFFAKKNNRRYFQYGGEVRFESATESIILGRKVATNRLTLRPTIIIGSQNNERLGFDTYIGIGSAMRFTSIRCFTNCDLDAIRENTYSAKLFSVVPTFHVGTKIGFGIKRK